MLYFAIPSLQNILPDEYFEHFRCIVSVVLKLLRNDITDEILEKSEADLKSFVMKWQILYGRKKMVYNVHLLLHMVDSVKYFGPLWGFSLFPYENMNGLLKNFIKGPKEPLLQVNNKYLIYAKTHNEQFSPQTPRSVINFCKSLLASGSNNNNLKNSKLTANSLFSNKY